MRSLLNGFVRRPGRRVLAASGALLVVAALGGIALATIPDSGGVIHGCYLKSGGTLRVIDASVTTCKKTEVSINWNQSGPQGPPGASASGAGYAEFKAGEGGSGAISLPEGGPAEEVVSLDIPAGWASDDHGEWLPGQVGLVAIATVNIDNASDVTAHPGCTVLSDNGGFGDGHTYVGAQGMTGSSMVTLTFQSTSPPDSQPPTHIWLECQLGSDHPPTNNPMNVRVLTASLSVFPRSF